MGMRNTRLLECIQLLSKSVPHWKMVTMEQTTQ